MKPLNRSTAVMVEPQCEENVFTWKAHLVWYRHQQNQKLETVHPKRSFPNHLPKSLSKKASHTVLNIMRMSWNSLLVADHLMPFIYNNESVWEIFSHSRMCVCVWHTCDDKCVWYICLSEHPLNVAVIESHRLAPPTLRIDQYHHATRAADLREQHTWEREWEKGVKSLTNTFTCRIKN